MRWACLLLPHLAKDAVLRQQPEPRDPAAPGVKDDPALEVAARDMLANWAYGFSSQVSLKFPRAIVLEIGASHALFGDWPCLERRLRSELQALGFRHRIVAAPNPFAARVLANVHDGLGIGEAHLDTALGQVPVARSGLPATARATLERSGLRTLREVFALSRDSIARRFPAGVLRHLDALRGLHAPPLPWFQPPDRFEARIEFDHEVESSHALWFPLRRLTADLAAFLGARDGGVQRFVLRFEHEYRAHSELAIGLLAPERDAGMLFEIARNRLDALRLPAAVRGLQLVVSELPAFVPASRDLFDARPQQAVPWEQLRERLRARLGDDAVQGIALQADHRPELATGDGTGARAVLPSPLALRPAWLLPRPVPLHGATTLLAGPERIESGWWDGGDTRRDYYVVETREGQCAWAFAPPGETTPLMLHGWFA